MKNALSKTELTGLFLLAILVVAITGGAFLLKGCNEAKLPPPDPNLKVESVDTSAPEVKEEEGKKKREKKKKKKGRQSKSSASRSGRETRPARDPFSDTVPRY